MNIFDILLIIPLVWGAYKGFTKGLIIELGTLASLILGIWVALKFSFHIANFLSKFITINPKYLNLIAFALTFILVLVLVFFISKLIERFVKVMALDFINKLAGACFGILKFSVVLSVVLFLINSLDKRVDFIEEKTKSDSLLYNPISNIITTILPSINDINFDELISKTPLK